MNEKLRDRLLTLTYGDVVDWVGEAVAARGFNYRDHVSEICELPDGYAAHVQGTNSYVTNLYADEHGEFCSVRLPPSGPASRNSRRTSMRHKRGGGVMKARFMILGLSMCGCAMAQESSENAVRELSEAEMIYGGCAFTRHCLRNYVSTNEPTVSAYGFGRLRFGQPGEFDLQKGEKEAWQILAPGEKPISSPMWGFEEDGSLLPCYMRYLCPATNDVDFAFLGKKIDRIRYGLGVTWLSRRTVSINAFVRFDEPEFTQADAEKVVVAVAEMPEIRSLGRMERQPLKCEPKVAKRTRLGKGKPRDEDNVRPRRAYACLAMSNESYKVEITSGVDGGGGSSPEPISVELSVGGKPHLLPYMNIQVVDFRIGRVAFQEEKATLKLMKEFSMPSTLGVDLSPIECAISPEAKKAEQLERLEGLLNQKTANRPDRACQNPGFRQK